MRRLSFVNKIIYLINSFFLLSLILSYIAPFLNPTFAWPISFFGLFFPVLYLINIIFLCYWLIGFKRPFLANLIIILIGIPHIGNFVGSKTIKDGKNESSIKILSYNVRIFNAYGWIPRKGVKEDILQFFKKENADILCIQEFYAPNKLPELEYKYQHIGLQNKKSEWHMAIYSNFPQIKKSTVQIEGKRMNNTCIFSDMIFKKDTIRVYNIHLASNWFKHSDYSFMRSPKLERKELRNNIKSIISRMKSSYQKRAKEVTQIKEHMKKCTYPIIICGDFNDTPLSFAYYNLANNKLDSFEEAGKGIGKSYTKVPALRIDYILHDPFFKTIKYKQHEEYLSDHFPISCELKINTNP